MSLQRAWIILAASLCLAVTAGVGGARAQSPSFDEVLAAPDDVDLNLRYAHERADTGRLLEAAAALERVLIARPNASDVRLLYVAVLYRMDDLEDAAAQLKLIDPAALSPVQRSEVGRYQRLVDGGKPKGWNALRVSGEVAAGVAWDSDAAGALLTQVTPYYWWEPPVRKQAGSGAVFSGHVDAAMPINPDGVSLVGSISGYDRSHTSGGRDEFWVGGAKAGAAYQRGRGALAVYGVARTYGVFSQHFLDEYGARGEGRWRLTPDAIVSIAVEDVRQDYVKPLYVGFIWPLGFQTISANGDLETAEASLAWRPTRKVTASLTAGVQHKTSSYHPFGFTEPYLQGAVSFGLARGAYLDLAGDYRAFDYAGTDWLFTGVTRHDKRGLARVALGAPLSALCRRYGHGGPADDIAIEASATYVTRTDRNPIAAYRDSGAELRLIWRFGNR